MHVTQTIPQRARRVLTLATAGLCSGAFTMFCTAPDAAAAGPAAVDLGPTNSSQTLTVPDGITTMEFGLIGGSGGTSAGNYNSRGGYGAVVTGIISVTPGQTVVVNVGGQGGHYGTNPQNNHGGWGGDSGGGVGAANPVGDGPDNAGGGGGGATTVYLDGVVVAVAGGGGGGGSGGLVGGGMGGDAGGSRESGSGGPGSGPCGPGDGGQAAAELSGTGGAAGNGSGDTNNGAGGGGGGGVNGGEGGHGGCASGGGGGAGSSMVDSSVTSQYLNTSTALGSGSAAIVWVANSALASPQAAVSQSGSGLSGGLDHPHADTIVAPGDTLSELAAKLHIPGGAAALFQQNKDQLTDPDSLIAGQQLRIASATTPLTQIAHITLSGNGAVFAQRSITDLEGITLVVRSGANGLQLASYHDPSRSGHLVNESTHSVTIIITRNGGSTRENAAPGDTLNIG